MKEFKFWCQKILPLVYDDSMSYYEVLCKVAYKLNELINGYGSLQEAITANNDMLESKWTQDISEAVTPVSNNVSSLQNQFNNYVSSNNSNIASLQEQLSTVQQWIDDFEWDKITAFVTELLEEKVPSIMTVSLDGTGHLLINYAPPWQNITFGTTGYDCEVEVQPEYGHLVVFY